MAVQSAPLRNEADILRGPKATGRPFSKKRFLHNGLLARKKLAMVALLISWVSTLLGTHSVAALSAGPGLTLPIVGHVALFAVLTGFALQGFIFWVEYANADEWTNPWYLLALTADTVLNFLPFWWAFGRPLANMISADAETGQTISFAILAVGAFVISKWPEAELSGD
jgi:hypothetical protein